MPVNDQGKYYKIVVVCILLINQKVLITRFSIINPSKPLVRHANIFQHLEELCTRLQKDNLKTVNSNIYFCINHDTDMLLFQLLLHAIHCKINYFFYYFHIISYASERLLLDENKWAILFWKFIKYDTWIFDGKLSCITWNYI